MNLIPDQFAQLASSTGGLAVCLWLDRFPESSANVRQGAVLSNKEELLSIIWMA